MIISAEDRISDFNVEISPGFHGIYTTNTWIPISIFIETRLPSFTGRVILELPYGDLYSSEEFCYSVSKELFLTAGQKKNLQFTLPLHKVSKLKIFIKESPLARKVFGAKEIVIIGKQVSGIKLTQSEKNRLSRDIRPKLRFIQEISKFSKEFNLKKGSENKEMVAQALEVIRRDKDFEKIREIWLFGSMVKNEMTVRSDIDIAVLFDKINLTGTTNFRIRVGGRVDDKIDVQVFSALPDKIKKSILKSHKVLYKR